jgi:hypothetical protein
MEARDQIHTPTSWPPVKNPGCHFVEECLGPRNGPDGLEKYFFTPAGIRTPDNRACSLVPMQNTFPQP